MRTRPIVRLALVALTLGACAKQDAAPAIGAATDPAAARQAIETANAGLIAALEKGDSTAATGYYADNAMVMPQGMNAESGRAGVQRSFGGMLSTMAIKNMKLNVSDVVASGDLAVETGRYAWTMVPKTGQPMTDSGKYVVAWKRQPDSTWKIYRDIFNNDAPPPAAPAKK